jgi:hypothetical protein
MIDDRTVHRLLDHIACEVWREMGEDGKTLEEIDDDRLFDLRKKDRVALFEYMAEQFPPEWFPKHGNAIVAHLRTLKRRKRSPQPRPPATILPFRPEERP